MYFNQSILQVYQIYKIYNDSVVDHNISISKDNPLAGSNYTKLPKESRKG